MVYKIFYIPWKQICFLIKKLQLREHDFISSILHGFYLQPKTQISSYLFYNDKHRSLVHKQQERQIVHKRSYNLFLAQIESHGSMKTVSSFSRFANLNLRSRLRDYTKQVLTDSCKQWGKIRNLNMNPKTTERNFKTEKQR